MSVFKMYIQSVLVHFHYLFLTQLFANSLVILPSSKLSSPKPSFTRQIIGSCPSSRLNPPWLLFAPGMKFKHPSRPSAFGPCSVLWLPTPGHELTCSPCSPHAGPFLPQLFCAAGKFSCPPPSAFPSPIHSPSLSSDATF